MTTVADPLSALSSRAGPSTKPATCISVMPTRTLFTTSLSTMSLMSAARSMSAISVGVLTLRNAIRRWSTEENGRRLILDVDHDLRRFLDHIDRFVTSQVGAVPGAVLVGEDDQRVEALIAHRPTQPLAALLVLPTRDGHRLG